MGSSPFKGMYLFLCGMCMGAADLIPGISGGTIAFIMGFYFPLLESLKSFNFSNLKLLFTGQYSAFSRRIGWKFLVILVAGILCSFFLFANLIHYILTHELYRVYLYSAFLGLILASFYFCFKQIQNWSILRVAALLIGMVIAFFLTGSSVESTVDQTPYAIKISLERDYLSTVNNYQPDQQLLTHISVHTLSGMLAKGIINPETPLYNEQGELLGVISDHIILDAFTFFNSWLIFCGAVAICGLLLPGISGSYLFTLLGVYPLVIGSLADWINQLKQGHFDWVAFEVLLNVGIGIIIGLALFARFLSWLLKTHPENSLVVLSGFMLGALRSVWPFWSYTYALDPMKLEKGPQLQLVNPIWPSHNWQEFMTAVFFAVAGFLLVFLLEIIAIRKNSKKINHEMLNER